MAERQRFWILSRMEPNGDTVCAHVYDDESRAEAALDGLPDVSALRDHGEAAYVVNVLRMDKADSLKPGEDFTKLARPSRA